MTPSLGVTPMVEGAGSNRVSLYELLRARHVPLREVSALGVDRDDLGAPVRTAARRAGLSPERLAAALGRAETAQRDAAAVR
nr:hypothetical protein [Tepidiforma sp.]